MAFARVIQRYTAAKADELSLELHDRVEVEDAAQDGWLYVRRLGAGEGAARGWYPAVFLQREEALAGYNPFSQPPAGAGSFNPFADAVHDGNHFAAAAQGGLVRKRTLERDIGAAAAAAEAVVSGEADGAGGARRRAPAPELVPGAAEAGPQGSAPVPADRGDGGVPSAASAAPPKTGAGSAGMNCPELTGHGELLESGVGLHLTRGARKAAKLRHLFLFQQACVVCKLAKKRYRVKCTILLSKGTTVGTLQQVGPRPSTPCHAHSHPRCYRWRSSSGDDRKALPEHGFCIRTWQPSSQRDPGGATPMRAMAVEHQFAMVGADAMSAKKRFVARLDERLAEIKRGRGMVEYRSLEEVGRPCSGAVQRRV